MGGTLRRPLCFAQFTVVPVSDLRVQHTLRRGILYIDTYFEVSKDVLGMTN